MPRIKPNTSPDAKSQEILAGVKKAIGSTPNIFTTLAQSPAALEYYVGGNAALGHTKISAGLREQLSLAVAGVNGCDYCASAHTALGKMRKLADDELKQNLSGKSADAKTQAALTFARKLVEGRGNVSDSDFNAVRSAGYSDGEIVEIIALVGINVFTNYFNIALGVEVDFPKVSTQGSAKAA